ncbi:hypothetical protein [Flavobacterium humi]|uniref:Uncharacterized protein n=1 Tax=Flavobacterium humi TaxID=2562683 RepID=A0A4Z0L8S9_9FLAO|nr:hypothetical protein [Flavobacterium humi]TGD58678.1 hypothetical protein E4635_07130 [Flavobacterium humi]
MQSFNWKSLFVNEEQNDAAKTENQNPVTFSKTENKFPETSTTNILTETNNNPFLNEIIEVYQKGFDGLNNEGFDFFELYKSVYAVGVTNPQSYQMAFAMGKTIKSDLSKDFLLEKSKFYIVEIEKVYAKYDATGNSKNKELNNTITSQKQNLSKEITDLESQIAKLQIELEKKKADLARIDLDNKEMFAEIQLKIEANNIAKQRILESINTVITGINQYL